MYSYVLIKILKNKCKSSFYIASVIPFHTPPPPALLSYLPLDKLEFLTVLGTYHNLL